MDALGQPTLEPPRRLERHDRRGDFTCGNDELDQWFHRYSWQNQKAHNAVTYVAQQGGRVAARVAQGGGQQGGVRRHGNLTRRGQTGGDQAGTGVPVQPGDQRG